MSTPTATPFTVSFSAADRRTTGLAGLVSGIVSVLMVALYFVYSGPPPDSNVLSRILLTVACLMGFFVFAVGLGRMLAVHRGGNLGLAGSLAVDSLLMYVAVTFVASALEVGTTLWRPGGGLDPTVDGPLAAAAVLLHGPVGKVLVATFLIGLAVASRGVLGTGVRRSGVVLAVLNLAMVPSLFFGMDAAFWYAANGWGSDALIGLVDVIWFGVLGWKVLRTPDLNAAAHRPTVARAA